MPDTPYVYMSFSLGLIVPVQVGLLFHMTGEEARQVRGQHRPTGARKEPNTGRLPVGLT